MKFFVIIALAGLALASPCKPKSVLSASPTTSVVSPTSSLTLPSATSGITTNPGQLCDATANLFIDGDLAATAADLPAWPHNITLGSPTYTRSTNCSTYAACIDIGLVVGTAQDVAFSQTVATVAGAAYTGHFFYRMTAFTASGSAMATVACTLDGVTKFTKTLCAGEQSAAWKQVSFGATASGADAVFKCGVTTAAVGAEFQFSDFVMNETC